MIISILSKKYLRPLIEGLMVVVIDVSFYSLVDPATAAPIVLLVGFLLLVITLYLGLRIGFAIVCQYLPGLGTVSRSLSLSIAGSLGILMALQTVGQLTTRDALVVIPLTAVLYLYFWYSHKKMRAQPKS